VVLAMMVTLIHLLIKIVVFLTPIYFDMKEERYRC